MPSTALLLAALRAAPRRYRMPPLPADAAAAAAAGTDTALAFALESVRAGRRDAQELFLRSLARLIRAALAPQDGDPAFQALVLRAQHPEVDEYVHLAAQLIADRRAVRAAVDAVAHPGKLRGMAPGALRDALAEIHGLAAEGFWPELITALQRASLATLLAGPALQRLARGNELLQAEAVQRYLVLCSQRGPLAGSDEATTQGRASARLGEIAEHDTVQAFRKIAGVLHGCRVVRSLRTPPGFPGEAGKAKDEWDAAIVHGQDIVLLAEVKAAPAAAAPDFARLFRGLQRLAHANAQDSYVFLSADGQVRLAGESLRRLRPHGRTLPPHVIYCCCAPAESQPPMLSAASKAVLLAEPASLAFAEQLTAGRSPPDADLAPVWDALATASHLRSALHQYETAQAVREAMLHPDDLLAAVLSGSLPAP